LIQNILKNFKNKLSDKNIDMKLIYFEISDDNKIYNLETCEAINYQISEERIFKI
jgi:hypothetical protein